MYDTLIMLKPGESFTVGELYRLVADVAGGQGMAVEPREGGVRATAGEGWLDVAWHDAAHVLEESDEIAGRFGVACRGCRARFEMTGDDPDMELFNTYLMINERLQATGKFVIFDTQEGKPLFGGEA